MPLFPQPKPPARSSSDYKKDFAGLLTQADQLTATANNGDFSVFDGEEARKFLRDSRAFDAALKPKLSWRDAAYGTTMRAKLEKIDATSGDLQYVRRMAAAVELRATILPMVAGLKRADGIADFPFLGKDRTRDEGDLPFDPKPLNNYAHAVASCNGISEKMLAAILDGNAIYFSDTASPLERGYGAMAALMSVDQRTLSPDPNEPLSGTIHYFLQYRDFHRDALERMSEVGHITSDFGRVLRQACAYPGMDTVEPKPVIFLDKPEQPLFTPRPA